MGFTDYDGQKLPLDILNPQYSCELKNPEPQFIVKESSYIEVPYAGFHKNSNEKHLLTDNCTFCSLKCRL